MFKSKVFSFDLLDTTYRQKTPFWSRLMKKKDIAFIRVAMFVCNETQIQTVVNAKDMFMLCSWLKLFQSAILIAS